MISLKIFPSIRVFSIIIFAATIFQSKATAQSSYTFNPPYEDIDENGVNTTTGSLSYDLPETSIGTGRAKLSIVDHLEFGSWKDNFSGQLRWVKGSNTDNYISVEFNGPSTLFLLSNGKYVDLLSNGHTLTASADGTYFLYGDRSGRVVRFDSVFPYNGSTTNTCAIIYTNPSNGQTVQSCAYVPTNVKYPDGLSYDISYTIGKTCPSATPCANPWPYTRIKEINTNFGTKAEYSYVSDTMTWENVGPWLNKSLVKLSIPSDPSSHTSVSYSYDIQKFPNPTTSSIVLPGNRIWTFITSYIINDDGSTNQYKITSIATPGHIGDTTITYYNNVAPNDWGPTPDSYGRVKSITKSGMTTSYTIVGGDNGIPNLGTVTTVDSLGRTSVTKYPAAADWPPPRPVYREDYLGRISQYEYDSSGRIVGVNLPEGIRYLYSYDSIGNITSLTTKPKPSSGEEDIVEKRLFIANCSTGPLCDKPISYVDADGNQTDYTYDQNTGQILTEAEAAPSLGQVRPVTTNTYTVLNGISLLESSSRCMTQSVCAGTPDEVKSTVTYNNHLFPVSSTTGNSTLSSTKTMTYDPIGNLESVDGPLPGNGDTTTYRYNASREVIGEISADPDGSGPLPRLATRTTYNDGGQITAVEKGNVLGVDDTAWAAFKTNQTISIGYDQYGRKSDETLSAAGIPNKVTQFSYDTAGRLDCTAIRMNPAAFASLPASACTLGTTGIYGPDRITKNVYDAAGQLIQVRKAMGTSSEEAYATYSYTPDGKQEYVLDANGNRAKMEYDGFDRQVKWIFPSATLPTAFNPSTQASALATAGALNTADYEAYTYDDNDNRKSLRKRDGQIINYSYDALNRMTLKDLPGGTALDVYYGYDLQGHQLYARFGAASGAGLTNAYDGLGRLASSSNNLSGTPLTLGYQYDANGNRKQLTHPDGTFFTFDYDGLDRQVDAKENGGTTVATIAYDDQGRRSGDTRGAVSSSYGYDAISRLSSLGDDLAGTADDVTTAFTYNPASQIVTKSRSNPGYAFNGYVSVNRTYASNGLNQYTTAGPATFGYDANGNLTSDGKNTFTYDVENRLVTRSGGLTLTYDPNGRLWQTSGGPSGTTRYLYDGDELVAEYDGSGTLLRRYLHGPGDDDPVLWYEGAGLSDKRSLQIDNQGSIVSIADASGNRIAIDSYDEYGIPSTGNIGRFQYTGQAWLPDLGMSYYKARMYSPTLGRFMQTDPIGYKDQINLYAYTGSDPANGRDTDGLQSTGNDIVISSCRWCLPSPIPVPVVLSPPTPAQAAREISDDLAALKQVATDITMCAIAGPGLCGHILNNKPPADATDLKGAKAPGKPGKAEGFKDPKSGPKWGKAPNGKSGWVDDKGRIWVPTGPKGAPNAHGGPHWDVQKPGGGYTNVYPGGNTR